jgi:hypothetical protein
MVSALFTKAGQGGEGYPQHVGNAVMERDGRMDELCAE